MNNIIRSSLAVAILFALPMMAFADVHRSVDVTDDDRIAVELSWFFDGAPDACLIVEERIPLGWIVDEVESSVGDPKMRRDDDRLRLATGVNQGLPAEGRVIYRLVPVGRFPSDRELQFEGVARTIRGTSRIEMPVDGDQVFEIPADAFPAPALRLTDFEAADERSQRGIRLGFMIDVPSTSSRRTVSANTAESQSTVYVDYRESLAGDVPWRCVYTSAPMDRLNSPGSIFLPPDSQPGFYRLRIETE